MADRFEHPSDGSLSGARKGAEAPLPGPAEASFDGGREAPGLADLLSAMTPRFGLFFRWFARRYFGHFDLDPRTVAHLREIERQGAVVYVMRYSSRLDYFLFNTLFMREGLRLSSFANGLYFYHYRPLLEVLRAAWFRKRLSRDGKREADREHVRRLAQGGQSLFLFLRTARRRAWSRRRFWSRRRRPVRRDELDLLEEVVRSVWEGERPISIVPLALFWRKGPRTESRFLNLSYGSLARPSDLAKVSSFLATYRSLSVKTRDPIDLRAFITDHRDEGPGPVARMVRRSILIYLYREEKVVEGPTLRIPARVLENVLSDSGVQSAIDERAGGKRSSPERARAEAEKIFREIAANMNSTMLAIFDAILNVVFRKMFSGLEVTGLEKVAEYAKRHPIVLVPSHRSYFDFMLVSWLFYRNFLVPPHIAARENMGFGPFGFLFRRCGAFFLRTSFDDPLYKEVFRSYVGHLVREGFTQEFFIEGGRSRTGKTLAPRLGMLTWDVDAFLESKRRDLFFVPVAITYERLVEESSIVGELDGAAKEKESVRGLVRARKYLQRRFGSVHVSFGESISLAGDLGTRRELFSGISRDTASGEPDEELLARKREYIEGLGRRIVERINWAAVANATPVAASVLLGSPHRGVLRTEMVERMQQIVDLLKLQDVRITPALLADEGSFRESIAFLERADLIRTVEDCRGQILYYEASRRRALDIYRNSIAHYLAAPSILSRSLLRGVRPDELRDDLRFWQDVLYQEYFSPRGEVLVAHCEGFVDHFERQGWIEQSAERLRVTPKGEALCLCLAEQTRGVLEAYLAACSVLPQADEELGRKELRKRAVQYFENAELLGEAVRPEAANDTTFTNLFDLLVSRGILETRREEPRGRGKGKQSEILYSRGESWDAAAELRERLASALFAR